MAAAMVVTKVATERLEKIATDSGPSRVAVGASEVQLNLIASRFLGLPRD